MMPCWTCAVIVICRQKLELWHLLAFAERQAESPVYTANKTTISAENYNQIEEHCVLSFREPRRYNPQPLGQMEEQF